VGKPTLQRNAYDIIARCFVGDFLGPEEMNDWGKSCVWELWVEVSLYHFLWGYKCII
jgi:hypothetical protein